MSIIKWFLYPVTSKGNLSLVRLFAAGVFAAIVYKLFETELEIKIDDNWLWMVGLAGLIKFGDKAPYYLIKLLETWKGKR